MRVLFAAAALVVAAQLSGCEVAFPVDDGVSAGVASPCSASHRFCADFDEGSLPDHPELVAFSAGGGALRIDATDARSLPGALLASSNALVATDPPAFAFIGPDVDGPFADMHLGFDLEVDTRGSGGNDVATIGLHGDGNDLYNVQVVLTGDGQWGIAEYRSTASPPAIFHANAGSVGAGWMKVRFDVHLDGDSSYAVLTVDDEILFAHESIAPSLTGGKPVIALGITSLYGPTSPWLVRLDNVTFDQ